MKKICILEETANQIEKFNDALAFLDFLGLDNSKDFTINTIDRLGVEYFNRAQYLALQEIAKSLDHNILDFLKTLKLETYN